MPLQDTSSDQSEDKKYTSLQLFNKLPAPMKAAVLYVVFLGLVPGSGYLGIKKATGALKSNRPTSTSDARFINLEETVETLAEEHVVFRRDVREIRRMVGFQVCSSVLGSSEYLELQDCLNNVEDYMRRQRGGM